MRRKSFFARAGEWKAICCGRRGLRSEHSGCTTAERDEANNAADEQVYVGMVSRCLCPIGYNEAAYAGSHTSPMTPTFDALVLFFRWPWSSNLP